MQLKPVLFFVFLIVLVACASQKVHQQSETLTGLFTSAKRIKLLAYEDRSYRIPETEEAANARLTADTSAFVVADLRIPQVYIHETRVLDRVQTDLLFDVLSKEMCDVNGAGVCYSPRHAIVFIDKHDKPFGYIELCFECTNYETSGDFKLDFCYEKSDALKSFFQSAGVTYFPVGEL